MNFGRIALYLVAILMLSAGSAWADLFEDADAAFQRGDHSTALRIWGSINTALSIYRPLAAQGNAEAQYFLGMAHTKGLGGVEKDYAEAVKWFRLAAAQRYMKAQYYLGVLYGTGDGVTKDDAEAAKWWLLAAAQGHVVAQWFLGGAYSRGEGVAQDYAESAKWYRLAAAQGNADAQHSLGLLYSAGRGVVQDYVRAFMWDSLAAAQGSPGARRFVDGASKLLTAQQIEQGQNLARACKASNFKQCGEPTHVVDVPPSQQIPPKQPESKKSSGTGFYVSGDGYLITNRHVIESCNRLNAIDESGKRNPLRVVRVLQSDDIALLKANIVPNSFAVFRETAKINQGETVVAYGYPLSGLLASGGNVSTGLVTALAGVRDDARQMQISAPVQPGNSGGPLVDSKGLVIGVVVSKLDAIALARITSDIPQNINFAIKSSSVINLLDMSSVKYRSDRLQRDLSVETLTSQMRRYTVKIECE